MSSFSLEFDKDGQRQEFSFDGGQVAIGRDRSADFVLDHPTVSRQHALIVADAEGHRLVVLSQGGMTAVDGEQVSGDVRLYDGSLLNFGSLQCTYRSAAAPQRSQGSANPFEEPTQAVPIQQQPGATASSSGVGWQQPPAASDGGGWQQPSTSSSGVGWQRPPAASEGGGGQQPPASSSGDGWQQPADPAPQSDDGIMSWDQIAAQAEASEQAAQAEHGMDGKTDFERIQAAQAKAEKQSKGTNPILLVALVLVVGFMGAVFLVPRGGDKNGPDPGDAVEPTGQISMTVDCVGTANCKAEALSAYKVGKATFEKLGADITNLYQAHYQFTRAEKLLEKGAVSPLPAEMGDLGELKEGTSDQLKNLWRKHRINYREHNNRGDYAKMARELETFKAYVPDERCDYNEWASRLERKMKDDGVYPRRRPTL